MDVEAMTHQWLDAVRSGKAKEFNNLTEKLVSQSPNSSELLHKTVGREQNTILHVATLCRRANMVDAILKINSSSSLLNIKNSRGNTPMHVAAAIGHAGIVRSLIKHAPHVLVDQENGAAVIDLKEMLCAKNEDDNTPLHEAAKMGHKQVVEMLLKALDPTLSGRVLNEDNKVGETPLSLAVLATSSSTVEVMLNTEVNFKPRGPHNQTLLHLTVLKEDFATTTVILRKRPDLIRARDIMGRTPLHYAAALDSSLLVRTLLRRDASLTYLADDTQTLPIHLAVEYNDYVPVVLEFYMRNPSVLGITDIKCRNVLHVAAQRGNDKTVESLMLWPEIRELINAADENGNTPLHLAAKNCHNEIVDLLSRDSRVDVGAINKDGHKAIDLINIVRDQNTPQSNHEDDTNSSSNNTRILLAEESLRYGMMKQAETLDDVLELRGYPRIERRVVWKQKDLAMVVMLVATLVTAVTYGVVFQIPGGYISGDSSDSALVSGTGLGSDVGAAVLSNVYDFQFFIMFDVIAMLGSMGATLLILWGFWRDNPSSFSILMHIGMVFTIMSIMSMGVAFASGMYVVLRKDLLFACVVLAVSFLPAVLLFVVSSWRTYIAYMERYSLWIRAYIMRHRLGL